MNDEEETTVSITSILELDERLTMIEDTQAEQHAAIEKMLKGCYNLLDRIREIEKRLK